MKLALWTVGKGLQFLGILLLPIALFMGIGGGDLGMEYAVAGIGLVAFFLGVGLVALTGGGS